MSTYSGGCGAGGDLGDNIGTGDRCVAAGGGGGGGPDGANGQNAYMDGTSNVDSKSGNGGDGTTSTITGVSIYYGGGGGGGGKGGGATLDSIVRKQENYLELTKELKFIDPNIDTGYIINNNLINTRQTYQKITIILETIKSDRKSKIDSAKITNWLKVRLPKDSIIIKIIK